MTSAKICLLPDIKIGRRNSESIPLIILRDLFEIVFVLGKNEVPDKLPPPPRPKGTRRPWVPVTLSKCRLRYPYTDFKTRLTSEKTILDNPRLYCQRSYS